MKALILFLLFLAFPVAKAADCVARNSNIGLIAGYNVNLRSDPNTSAAIVETLNLGASAEIIERGKCETIAGKTGHWVKVRTWRPERFRSEGVSNLGWLFDASLAYSEMFKPVTKWEGPPELFFGGGDYVNQYAIASDGKYVRTFSNEGNLKTNSGRLLSFRAIFLARSDTPEGVSILLPFGGKFAGEHGEFFFQDRNGIYCEATDIGDARGLCPDGPIDGQGPR